MSDKKRITFLTLQEDLPCYNCIHRTGKETCNAFPNGIPEVFNYGSNIHTIKHPDQVGDFLLEPTEEYEKRRAELRAESDRKGQERRAIGESRSIW